MPGNRSLEVSKSVLWMSGKYRYLIELDTGRFGQRWCVVPAGFARRPMYRVMPEGRLRRRRMFRGAAAERRSRRSAQPRPFQL